MIPTPMRASGSHTSTLTCVRFAASHQTTVGPGPGRISHDAQLSWRLNAHAVVHSMWPALMNLTESSMPNVTSICYLAMANAQVVRKALDEGYEVRCTVRPRQNPADFLRDWGATTVQVGLTGRSTDRPTMRTPAQPADCGGRTVPHDHALQAASTV